MRMKRLLAALLIAAGVMFTFASGASAALLGDLFDLFLGDEYSYAYSDEYTPDDNESEEYESENSAARISEDGTYISKEEVALYLHTYGRLPKNFITKKQARNAGWDSSYNRLSDVCPGKSLGGSYYGNYEGLLPDGDWRECDINYRGGKRGPERLVYLSDASMIYYTGDHYNTFERLY